ncbi:hypothetical protein HDV00_009009 [Rhizophlyctis rosea]|nr:hypothetical protein HDV00_009009 [Rhizophlyctis rosea]
MPCCNGNNGNSPKPECKAKFNSNPRCSTDPQKRPNTTQSPLCGGASCSDCVVVDLGNTTQHSAGVSSAEDSGGGDDDEDGDSCCASRTLKDNSCRTRTNFQENISQSLCKLDLPLEGCSSEASSGPCCRNLPDVVLIDVPAEKVATRCGNLPTPCCEASDDLSSDKKSFHITSNSIGAVTVPLVSKGCGGDAVNISNDGMDLVKDVPDTWLKLRLKISGLTCTSCEKTLLDAIREYPHTRPIAVSLFNNTADIAYDPVATTPNQVMQFLTKKTGFVCEINHVASATVARFYIPSTEDSIKQALAIVEGQRGTVSRTIQKHITPNQHLLVVEFDPDRTGTRTLRDRLLEGGVDAIVFSTNESNANSGEREIRFWLIRLIVSTLLCIPVVILAYAVPHVSANVALVNNLHLWTVISGILAGIIQIYAAAPIHRAAWTTLFRSRKVEMDMLVSLSTSVAYIYSIVAVLVLITTPTSELEAFFETASLLVTLVILGRYVTVLARGKASNAIEALRRLQPSTALLAKQDVEGEFIMEEGEELAVELLQRRDVVFVRPSSRIPADGLVVKGKADVDESMITGESLPVLKQSGSKVLGGTISSDGTLIVQISHVPSEGVLSGIQHLVQDAQSSRAPTQALADRIASIFTPAVLVIAAIVFFIWLGVGMSGMIVIEYPPAIEALLYAIAVLIVSCPCAVGLAVPTVIVVAAGVSALRGILFKNGASLESSASIDVVVFDKTGTLTTGEFSVMDEIYGTTLPQEELKVCISAIANLSEHVLARSITDHLQNQGHQDLLPVSDFSSSPGLGVQGVVHGSTIRVGRPSWVSEKPYPPQLQSALASNLEHGRSVVAASVGEELVAIFGLSDSLRVDAKEAVKYLVSQGIQVHVFSGDNPDSVQRLSTEIGVDASNAIGGCLPADKLARIKLLQRNGHRVAFVGDGSNDAPALAQADVGVAFGSGTDLALNTAEVVLLQPSTMAVADVLVIAKRARRTIIANFAWAFIYNVVAVLLAAGAFVSLGKSRKDPPSKGTNDKNKKVDTKKQGENGEKTKVEQATDGTLKEGTIATPGGSITSSSAAASQNTQTKNKKGKGKQKPIDDKENIGKVDDIHNVFESLLLRVM